MKRKLLSVITALLVYYWFGSTFLEAVSVVVSVYSALTFINRIGQEIALLACIDSIAALEILLVPAMTYRVFPASMPIESATYFGYALPAFLAFHVGLNSLAQRRPEQPHRLYLAEARIYLQDKQKTWIVLFSIGLTGFWLKTFFPAVPAFLSVLPSYCLFISVLYAYYAHSPYWLITTGAVGAILLTYTIQAGMFGDLFFWLVLMVLFWTVSTPRPPSVRMKAALALLAVGLLLLIQSIKGEYRYNTWGYHRHERSGDGSLMTDLLTDRLANPEKILNTEHLFLSSVRFNQGLIIGSAMTKVPTHEAFAKGEVLLSLVYPFIPRFIWPDKPQTGGRENIRRFTMLPQSENTSINLSPLGEGYVNFGYGGIAFAGLYGLLLAGVYRSIFSLAHQMPSIILWLPMLFVGCLTMETDLLSTWGSLLNSAIFIYLLVGVLKRIGIQL